MSPRTAHGGIAQAVAALTAILGSALLLVLGAQLPAKAQTGHTHNFSDPGSAPSMSWQVSHLGGSAINAGSPARPCEFLQLAALIGEDVDVCTNNSPPCNFSYNGQPGHFKMTPGGAHVAAWDDFGEPGRFGKFDANNNFIPTDGGASGFGDTTTTHYHVDRDKLAPYAFKIRLQIDDEAVWPGTPPVTVNDEPARWLETDSLPVAPPRLDCDIDRGRDSSSEDSSVCMRGSAQPGYSSITPLDGNGSFTVPITSWGYRGDTLDFALTCNSQSVIDPDKKQWQIPHPGALSDNNRADHYNPKWTHTFAQWIEVLGPAGDGAAVWNRGDGSRMAFEQYWVGEAGPFWRSEESYHTLTSAGNSTSPDFEHEGDSTTETVPYGNFVLTDGVGTRYTFGRVRWNCSSTPVKAICYAIPYFLLTNITDRWGRTINVTWGADESSTTPLPVGVTAVTDGDGRGVSIGYSGGLISTVTDPMGRTHTISRTSVATPSGGSQSRPTGITVYGPGSPNRVTYTWAFTYGTATGDLVITKTEPTGRVVNYEYQAVNAARTGFGDWDGRLTRAYFYDDLENPTAPVLREILRSGNTLTYPGGDAYVFTYDGDHLKRIEHDSTNAFIEYEFDAFHNLTKVWTALESASSPLASLEYQYGGADQRQIVSAIARDRMYSGGLGHQAGVVFNALNLPISATVFGDDPSRNQTTQLVYDNGGPLTAGNLTQIIEAAGTPSQQATALAYTSLATPALPTAVQDSVGGISQAAYHVNGVPALTQSPPNLLAAPGDPDALPSTSSVTLNADELPRLVTDSMGHQELITYNRHATNTSWLVVTVTHQADNSTKKITLDAAGRVVAGADEQNVRSEVDYGRGGQPLEVRENVGFALTRVTKFFYDSHGDLAAVDPPTGSTGRIQFDYRRYNKGFIGAAPTLAFPVVYEGQVSRITYADGTSETYGFDGAEELMWRYSQDGRYTELTRDALHRVTSVSYPATATYATAISVATQYDEFGRVEQTTDATGTSTFTFDHLNRLKTATPALGQAASYTYTPDPALKRWITGVSLAGVTGSWQFGEDGKGRGAQVLNPFGQLTQRRFDPDGKLLQEQRANGAYTTYGYTSRDWLSSIEHRLANNTLLDRFDYSYHRSGTGVYDPTGHLQKETDAGGRAHSFDYDRLYRLTQETHPDFGAYNYTLDLNNNRTRRQQSTANVYSGYDAHNKLLWTNTTNAAPTTGQANPYRKYTYNGNGEPTSIERRDSTGSPVVTDVLEWDGMGKLRKVTSAGTTVYTATYDGAGDRVQSTQSGATHTYSYGAGLLYDSVGSTTYTPGVSHRQAGVDSFYHEDWIGSNRYTTDATGLVAPSGQRWDAFGNLTASAGTHGGSLKWVGGHGYESDGPLGMSVLGARNYDPGVGRFLSRDPIGIAGGLNQFGYCLGDSVNLIDPSGLWATGSYLGDVGQVFVGYGRALGGIVRPILHPRQTIRELGSLWNYGRECGAGAAGGLVLGALWKSHTEWATTSDPAAFGESFGTLLTTVATAAAPFAKTPCFPAGTEIATPEGEKPIEEIRVGDTVLSADPETGHRSYQKVVRAFVRQTDELILIRLNSGELIRTTPEHPFWVEGKGFIAAKHLARSDLLRRATGAPATIASVDRRSDPQTVYNFEVEKTHTYFAAGVWVHNACGVGAARSALNRGATTVRVATRAQAEQLLWERWAGYRNLTDSAPGEAFNAFGMKDKYYHWDEVFDTPEDGITRLRFHGSENAHAYHRHLQVHDPASKEAIRIHFGKPGP